MTPSELIINFVIGIVTGLATGAFFAARTKPGDLSIDDFVFRNYAWRHHATLTINVRYEPVKSSPSDSTETEIAGILVLAFLALAISTAILANYQQQVLSFGWLLISFFGASVASFIFLSFLRDRIVSWFGLWSLICILGITFNFWIFSLSLSNPVYASYLQDVRNNGVFEAISRMNDVGFLPLYQLIGLVFLCIVAGMAFVQSFFVLLWPLILRNRIILFLFRWTGIFVNKWSMFSQAVLLFVAYSFLSGKILQWFDRYVSWIKSL
jgi:hypothetical protein